MTTKVDNDSPQRVSVLADDSTGAADTVVQFRNAGWKSYLLVSEDSTEDLGVSGALAISRSLSTRALPEPMAAQRTSMAVEEEIAHGSKRLFLKVDSTLRGSINGQIEGALRAWSKLYPGAYAVVCPAYPDMGRTVVDGKLLVYGELLHRSGAAVDPVTPVSTSVVTDIIGPAVSVTPGLRTGAQLADVIARHAFASSRVVMDARSNNDLELIGEAVDLLGPQVITVGSAGVARVVARRWLESDTPRLPAPRLAMQRGLLVVVVSSLSDVALQQTKHLLNSLGSRVLQCELTFDDLSAGGQLPHHLEDVVHTREASVLLLQPVRDRMAVGDAATAAQTVSHGLGSATRALLELGVIGGLILVGGDGAHAVLMELGVIAVQILGSVHEGSTIGEILGGPAAGITVMTKAGGFGDTDSLTRLVSAFFASEELEEL